jgi:hypothetical protein
MSTVWKALVGFAGGGLLTVLLMKEVKMHTTADETFALETERTSGEKKKNGASKASSLKEVTSS